MDQFNSVIYLAKTKYIKLSTDKVKSVIVCGL